MTVSSIQIATTDDIPELVSLVNSAYRGEEARKGWTHEADLIDGEMRTDANDLRTLMQKPGAVFLKCINGGQLQGTVYLEEKASSLYLGMLSVWPRLQGTGTGKKLLGAAEAFAQEKNCDRIHLTVISTRKELIQWYEKHGYHSTGATLPFPDDGRFGKPRMPLRFAVMEKKIGAII